MLFLLILIRRSRNSASTLVRLFPLMFLSCLQSVGTIFSPLYSEIRETTRQGVLTLINFRLCYKVLIERLIKEKHLTSAPAFLFLVHPILFATAFYFIGSRRFSISLLTLSILCFVPDTIYLHHDLFNLTLTSGCVSVGECSWCYSQGPG